MSTLPTLCPRVWKLVFMIHTTIIFGVGHLVFILPFLGYEIWFSYPPCWGMKNKFEPLVHPTAANPFQVFEASWWACSYGAPTPKRHIGWSNCRTIKLLDLGRMIKAHIKKKNGVIKSSKTYRNRRGQKAFCGSSHLKSTQTLASGAASCWLKLFAF